MVLPCHLLPVSRGREPRSPTPNPGQTRAEVLRCGLRLCRMQQIFETTANSTPDPARRARLPRLVHQCLARDKLLDGHFWKSSSEDHGGSCQHFVPMTDRHPATGCQFLRGRNIWSARIRFVPSRVGTPSTLAARRSLSISDKNSVPSYPVFPDLLRTLISSFRFPALEFTPPGISDRSGCGPPSR
ncbi:hypothetical protein VTK26DRAFT_5216 [Humicola hyalothermophila]